MREYSTIKIRLQRLEVNLAELESLHKEWSGEQVVNDKAKQWAIRYGVFESIQLVIDTACNFVSLRNLGSPDTYLECLELLHQFKYIDENLFSSLKPIIGLRNILIHDYIKIDVRKIFQDISDLKPFYTYIERMMANL